MIIGSDSLKLEPGLQSVDNETTAPCSIIFRAGAYCFPLSEKVVPGSSEQVKSNAAQFLEGADFAGADWTKPVTVVVLGGKVFGKVEPAIVGIFPLTDAGKFRQAREQAARENEKLDIRGNYALLTEDEGARMMGSPACRYLLQLIGHLKSNSPSTYRETQLLDPRMSIRRKEVIAWLREFDEELDRGAFRFQPYPRDKWRE